MSTKITNESTELNLLNLLHSFRGLHLLYDAPVNIADYSDNKRGDNFMKNSAFNLENLRRINYTIKDDNLVKDFVYFSPNVLISNEQFICNNSIKYILVAIQSRPEELAIRMQIRQLFEDIKNVSDYGLKYMFVLGRDKTVELESIREESNTYHDILMIDMEENYRNLMYKHLGLINWLTDYCENAVFVVKLEQDVLVDVVELGKHLLDKFSKFISVNTYEADRFLYCQMQYKAVPQRSNLSKWYIDYETYPFDWYPPYCDGLGYVTNINTLFFIKDQSLKIPRFWLDDVYFTGILLYGMNEVKRIDFDDEVKKLFY